MLSGQFTPSSANFVPRQQQLLNEDDTTSTQLSTTGKDEKIYSTSIQTNFTTIQSTTTTTGPTPVSATTTTIPIPGILNLSSLPCNERVPDGLPQLSLHVPANLSAAAIATNSSANDANGRSAALERAYVHDVYENCEEPSGPIRPRVAQFLAGLEPGSIVCDVGCGNGRYLTSCNPLICTIGVDRCYRLTKIARERGGEVALCDNLELPFRDESFDAVLSLAVVHHFATTERRVGAIRELARILRIGGRVIITVWALEQRHRRFESQDVLIPWQPPKNRNYNYSDDEDDDEYLPPYHAYTEDSTNSSRSAGDGDSSSLSSSSPGESCYSFVRRAIQKLAGGRKHSWFLDSWNSKDTKNDSSLDYEDAKDLPIELRRLEDFEDFPEPPLSAGLKSRSLGSILNPPPRQIVRSRSSVPSLGAQMPEQMSTTTTTTPTATTTTGATTSSSQQSTATVQQSPQKVSITTTTSCTSTCFGVGNSTISQSTSVIQPDKKTTTATSTSTTTNSSPTAQGTTGRRPKLVKQKQSLCDEEYQLPDNPFHNTCSNTNSSSCCYTNNITNSNVKSGEHNKLFLRKQSSLNEELMAESRLREKERVRKRIQKQMSLNEAFLCRSLFSKRLQVIREGFTTKLKTSTGSLERATKNGFVKIMQNFKSSQFTSSTTAHQQNSSPTVISNTQKDHSNDSSQHNSNSVNNQSKASTVCSGGSSSTNSCNNNNCNNSCSNISNGNEDQKPRRHSRESGSDSSKDSSLQSDTSIESEDSFASVIYIPRPEQQGSGNVNNINNSNNNNSNNLFNNSNSISGSINCKINNSHKIPSVPTSPLILPCPPTPAHSPAAATTITTTATTTMTPTGMSILSPPKSITNSNSLQGNSKALTNRFTFDEEHILQHHQQNNKNCLPADTLSCNNRNNISKIVEQRSQIQQKISKITRQAIKELPTIPKFRKQQSLQPQIFKAFPIVRRASAAPAVPKLMSLELFNPETDDLDSDSSEPSSPDSIDSVISALKPGIDEDLSESSKQQQKSISEVPKVPLRYSIDVPSSNKFPTQKDIHQQYSLDSHSIEKDYQHSIYQEKYIPADISKRVTQSNSTLVDNTSVVKSINSDITTDKYIALSQDVSNNSNSICNSTNPNRQEFVEFAEKLSAQLLKELEENDKLDNNLSHTKIDGEDENFTSELITAVDNPFVNKQNGDMQDLCTLREELRERRLMLANLTSQYNQQKLPTPTSSSTSSLSSQTRSFTIHEEEDEENEAYISAYDSKTFKAKYLKNLSNSSGYQQYNFVPDTAFLIEDDGEGSGRDDDVDEMENGVILEEDEDQLEAEAEYDAGDCDKKSGNITGLDEQSSPPTQLQLETRQSTESWGHSNSETSLDSPSQGGGATTHHRYYHVFREGELDALINHHVTSLHIVSSYYERASWCVVAEKVQVWTI